MIQSVYDCYILDSISVKTGIYRFLNAKVHFVTHFINLHGIPFSKSLFSFCKEQ